MKPDQITAVQQSFDRVFPIKNELAKTFYEKLFEIASPVRAMFPDDMDEQRQKLSDTLAYLVPNLHRPEVVEETILGLARRHKRYGALPAHFGPVGLALVHALKTHMPGANPEDEGMSEEEAVAWLEAYTFIADMMIAELTRAA